MSSYAERLAVDIRNAYEGRDRDAMESALTRMVAAIAYTGPVEGRQRASDCSKGKDCTCDRPIQRETCATRTEPRPEVQALVDRMREKDPQWPHHALEIARFADDNCARKLLGCECTTPEQQSHCMFRAT